MPQDGSTPRARDRRSTDARALQVVAPLSGTVVALVDVPDPVFKQGLVGPGVAIVPAVDDSGISTVRAPATGTIGSLFPHAFALEADGGRTVLVHLGIGGVRLGGEGAQIHVEEGEHVEVGTTLLSWEPPRVAALGLSTVCPIVALQGDPAHLTVLVDPGQVVQAGDPVLSWA